MGWQALIFGIFYLIQWCISETRLSLHRKWITNNRWLTLEYILQMISAWLLLIFPYSLILALTGDQIICFLCGPWNIRSVAQRPLRIWSRLGVNPFFIILTFFLLYELRISQVGERGWQSLFGKSRRCLYIISQSRLALGLCTFWQVVGKSLMLAFIWVSVSSMNGRFHMCRRNRLYLRPVWRALDSLSGKF